MDAVVEFLNQPIVLTLLTLVVGSYLLSLVADRRSRRDKLKDQAIEFINDAGSNINEFLPHVYAHLRTGSIHVDEAVDDGMKKLFSKSMSIRIGSRAYLKSDSFHDQYVSILNELGAVVSLMNEVEQGGASEDVSQKIEQNITRLMNSWPMPDEKTNMDKEHLVEGFIVWMDMIVNRAADLLTSHLKMVMGT